jgi:hypothetical protein
MRAGGGMEYPTITIIDKTARSNFQTVIVHEAGHNWFYGMLGNNERDDAWLDEGLNTFYEKKTLGSLHPDSGIIARLSKLNENLLYYELAVSHNDQNLGQTSANFSKLNYGIDVYYKSALFLRWLEQYMGSQNFEKGIKDYFQQWKYKHPTAIDLREALQKQTTKSLGWFFDELIYTQKKIDYTFTKAKVNGNNTEIIVNNKSGIAAPVKINAFDHDNLIYEAWIPPFKGKESLTIPISNWTQLKIDSLIPDAKSTNDIYRRNALIHRYGLRLKLIGGLNTAERDKVYIAPALGYNQNNGLLGGILLHNLTLPETRFRFVLAPLFSFAANTFTGAASVGYMFYPKGKFRDILVQADAKTFHNNKIGLADEQSAFARYHKSALSATFHIREPDSSAPETEI